MNAPEVSVIVPVHDGDAYLPALLDSLAAQDGVALEFLFIDDGSTDQSLRLLSEFCAREPRARLFRHATAQGSAAARNRGIAEAQGRYLGFADADDACMPGQFRDLHVFAERLQLDVAYANAWRFSLQPGDSRQMVCSKAKPADVVSGADWLIHSWRVGERVSATWLSLVRRDLVQQHALRFPTGEIMDDELWTPALMLRAQRVAWLDQPVYYYRNHLASITQNREAGKVENRLRSLVRVAQTLFDWAAHQDGELAQALRWRAFVNGDAALGSLKRLPRRHGRREAFQMLRDCGLLRALWQQNPTFRLGKRIVRETLLARLP